MIVFRNCAVLLVIASICSFLYGIAHIHLEVEPNACRMTYMFGEPRFARVRFNANKLFPNYGLYYYYEGMRQPLDPLKTRMTGAPVIFVPGNAGSYKQVRSLASVALRKAGEHPHTGKHLDYYTIDYDEELSALYGGYMYHQQSFLKHCIRTIASLYSQPSPVVLIGHSMGGKLAQSVLTDAEISQHINAIISISTPLDHPVLNLDAHLGRFYSETHEQLSRTRTATQPSIMTNVCQSLHQKPLSEQSMTNQDLSAKLDNVLLISTGGGNRDLLVQAGLTTSQFNDLHAMTSAIPRVSLSCDHLSAVWCLQFMQVINGFLFSISQRRDDGSVVFSNNKHRNMQSALGHFVKSPTRQQSFIKIPTHNNWHEERSLVINKFFTNGLKSHYYELIGLGRQPRYKKLAIEALNIDGDENWLFGCESYRNIETGQNYCHKATSLTHLVQRLPNADQDPRSVAILDLHNLRNTYEKWTHLLVRLPPGSQRTGYNLDIYDPKDRILDIRMPRWYASGRRVAINETLQGTIHYRMRIADLVEPYQSLRVYIDPQNCLQPKYRITVRLCVPWAAGFERYHTLTSPDQKPGLYINVPVVMPRHYNTTLNPVLLDLYLDPICRYRISYENSYADALSRIVLEFYGWMPAHFVCVLLIVLRNQLDKFQVAGSFQSLKPYIGYLQYTSLYVVTGCRLFKKLVLNMKMLPIPEQLDYSINISIIIHCTAIGLSVMTALALWFCLTTYGNAIHRLALRLTRLSSSGSNIMLSIMTHLPITYGILTISVALGACSGLALFLAFVFYFLMVSNAYKDYLEDYLWQKAANLVHMATGIGKNSKTTKENQSTAVANAIDQSPVPSDDDEQSQNQGQDEQHEQKPLQPNKDKAEEELCVGLQNFSFHVTLLLLLLTLLLLSVPASLAWLRSRRHGIILPDPALHTTIVSISSISLLLQLRSPQKLPGYWILSVLLYLCAGTTLLYCQIAIYRLNYIIAGAFAVIAIHQVLQRLYHKLRPAAT
ncbi:PREDICTED: GPI inositol-deacylase [Drosophila arizonae]|uniref:GPI inositol-deacylase n=1 Tax=Drosophila arizonae TaxID=7263 RepID=A0ABM1PUZ9_DROAR|nr:PREDICTED: GPI inositol-deacylase [Drosophila arizonae]